MIATTQVKAVFEQGAVIEITCLKSTRRAGSTLSGAWTVAVTPLVGKNKGKKLPVFLRSSLRPLEIKTVQGIALFGLKIGSKTCTVPFYEGDKVIWTNVDEG